MIVVSSPQVGFKPAGGIRTAQESLVWLTLMKEELGDDWLNPHLFRLGASSLLADIERQVMTSTLCFIPLKLVYFDFRCNKRIIVAIMFGTEAVWPWTSVINEMKIFLCFGNAFKSLDSF